MVNYGSHPFNGIFAANAGMPHHMSNAVQEVRRVSCATGGQEGASCAIGGKSHLCRRRWRMVSKQVARGEYAVRQAGSKPCNRQGVCCAGMWSSKLCDNWGQVGRVSFAADVGFSCVAGGGVSCAASPGVSCAIYGTISCASGGKGQLCCRRGGQLGGKR